MRQRHRDDTERNKSSMEELRLRYMEVINTNKFLLAQLAEQNIPSADGDAAAFHSLVNSCADNLTEMAQKEREKENTTLFGPEQLNCSFSGFVNDRIGPVTNLLKRIMEQATSKLGINAVTDDVDNIDDGDNDEMNDSWRASKCIALCLAAMLEYLAGNHFRFDCTISFELFLAPSVGIEHRSEVIKLFSKFASGSIADMVSINNILAKNDTKMRDITSPTAASDVVSLQCFDNGPASTFKTKKYISPTSRNTEVRQTSVVTYRMTLRLLDEDVPRGILNDPRARIDPEKLKTMTGLELILTPADHLVRANMLAEYGRRALEIIKTLGIDAQGNVMVGVAPPSDRNMNSTPFLPRSRKATAPADAPPGFHSIDTAIVAGGLGGAGEVVANAVYGSAGAYPPSTVHRETQTVMFVNPGSRPMQELVMNQCKYDHRVEGAEGIRSAEDDDINKPLPQKLVTLFSMDKGATPLGIALWDKQSIFLLCRLHVGFALEHVIGLWLKETDNSAEGTIPVGYGFTKNSKGVLYGDGCDHHKFADFEDALTLAMMVHFYSMAIKQGHSDGYKFDLQHVNAVATLNEYVMQDGGGVRFESSKSFLLDVLLVQRGLRASTAAGPSKFKETCSWLKFAKTVFFASGCTRMAPELTYYLLLLHVMFKDYDPMLLVLERTYSMRTVNGADRNASYQCGDALMENRVQAAVRCTLSPSQVGIIRANYMSGGLARHNKDHVYKMLGVKNTPFLQRSKIQQYQSTLGMVRALNAGMSGLFRDQEHPEYSDYKSLDGKQTKNAALAIHAVIADGEKRAHAFLRQLNDGVQAPPINISKFAQRDATARKEEKQQLKEQLDEDEGQKLRDLDAEFADEL